MMQGKSKIFHWNTGGRSKICNENFSLPKKKRRKKLLKNPIKQKNDSRSIGRKSFNNYTLSKPRLWLVQSIKNKTRKKNLKITYSEKEEAPSKKANNLL